MFGLFQYPQMDATLRPESSQMIDKRLMPYLGDKPIHNITSADVLAVLRYTRAAVLVTLPNVAAALADVLDTCPELTTVLLVPDTATGDDPEAPAKVPPELADVDVSVLPLASCRSTSRPALTITALRCEASSVANSIAIWPSNLSWRPPG